MYADRFREVDWRPSSSDRRKFGLTLAVGCPITGMALFLIIRLSTGDWKPAVPTWIIGVGCPLGLLLTAVPAIARPFYIVWFTTICLIDTTLTIILFTVLFYVVIFPIGLLMRVLGRLGITKGNDPDATTYWRNAEPPREPRRYFRQF